MDRARRNASAQRAYEAQVRAGTEGLVKFTGLGVGLAILGHYTWPFFRRQTLPFKGFLVSTCAIFGLVTYAESALQTLEAEERLRESAIRKEARYELNRRGMVPTETAIAQWKEEHLKKMAEAAAEEPPRTSTPS